MSVSRRYTIAYLEQMTAEDGERLELIDGVLYVSCCTSHPGNINTLPVRCTWRSASGTVGLG